MPDKELEARRLADAHYQIEDGITHIFRLYSAGHVETRPNEPIKLLEVNRNTIPSGVMPLQFGPQPSSGFHFPSVIVEVTPEEFDMIQAHQLPLPNGWTVGTELPRPAGVIP